MAVTVRVTLEPRVIVDAEVEKELIVGPLGTAEKAMAWLTLAPFTVIVPEEGATV